MEQVKTLRIYFTSDIHGYIYPTSYREPGEQDIGLFKCVNHFEKDGNTLIIDGGDLLQGSPLGAYQHDTIGTAKPFAEIMNSCGYDYVTLGNHDFNFGMDYLESYLGTLNARCICENIKTAEGKTRFPWQLHTLENGLKVGIAGIVTDYVNVWERPEHLGTDSITNPLAAAKAALDDMRDKVDITICVYHGGFERDLSTGRVLSQSSENIACRICDELDFDILLTGHQHMSVHGQTYNGTYIVQPIDSGREFISITAEVGNGIKKINGETIPAGGTCPQQLLERFRDMEEGAQLWLDSVVGYMNKPLMPSDHLSMAANGCALTDFFNTVQMESTGAEISVTSLANEISGLPQKVRRRDVLTAYPYTNTMVVLEITGAKLKAALERSAEYFELDAEGKIAISETFLKPKVEHYNYDYYAGIEYVFDIRKPVGNRLAELKFNGKNVENDDKFTLCLNSYRASGAGGYSCYCDCPKLKEDDTEMADLILAFFDRHPKVDVEKAGKMTILPQ